jgi:hypothetical protein
MKTPRHHFSYFSLDEAFGWLTPSDTLLLRTGQPEQAPKRPESAARAYLQQLYQEFLDL